MQLKGNDDLNTFFFGKTTPTITLSQMANKIIGSRSGHSIISYLSRNAVAQSLKKITHICFHRNVESRILAPSLRTDVLLRGYGLIIVQYFKHLHNFSLIAIPLNYWINLINVYSSWINGNEIGSLELPVVETHSILACHTNFDI